MAHNLRCRLRNALLKQLFSKTSKTEELIGVTFEEFKYYIEFLMSSEMKWNTIHFDHVRPLSSFDLTNPEQLKEATHYTNIQPLLKKDNLIKRDKYQDHDLAVQRNNVYEYEYYKFYCC